MTAHAERAPATAMWPARTAGRWLSEPVVWYTIALLVAGCQTWLVFAHEAWADEWQALQIALQSPGLAALFHNLRYEGHPPLWYLWLRGIGAAGVPAARVLAVAEWPIAIGLQALILFRAPITKVERLALATSFFVVVEYGILSRSLGLGVLLLTGAVLFRRHRAAWIAIALLPLCDFLFGVLGAGLVLLAWRERRLWRPGILLFLLAGLGAAWSVRPAPDMWPANLPAGLMPELVLFLRKLSVLLVPLQMADGRLAWNMPLAMPIAAVAGPLFLLFGDRQLRSFPALRAAFLFFAALCALFCGLVYPLSIRHLSLIAWLLVLLKWIAREQGDRPDRWWMTWLAALSVCGVTAGAYNAVVPFDAGGEAAAWIERQGLAGKHWIAFPASRGQVISARLGIPMHRLGENCTQTFVRWNAPDTIVTPQDLARALRGQAAIYGRMYIVSDGWLDPAGGGELLRLIKHVPGGYDGQAYNLYVVAPAQPESARRPPPCTPERLPMRAGI